MYSHHIHTNTPWHQPMYFSSEFFFDYRQHLERGKEAWKAARMYRHTGTCPWTMIALPRSYRWEGLMAVEVQPCKEGWDVIQSIRCLIIIEQSETIVVVQSSQVLPGNIRPTQIASRPSISHVASVVRLRVCTGFFGKPTAEFKRLKESIRFKTSRPVPRIKESPLLRVCAIKDWLPSHDVFNSSATVYMSEIPPNIPCSVSRAYTIWWSRGSIQKESGLEWIWCLGGDDRNVAKAWRFWWRVAKWWRGTKHWEASRLLAQAV